MGVDVYKVVGAGAVAVVAVAAADGVVVADGKLYFLFAALPWVFSLASLFDWSLLLCLMYLRGHSGSKVSTIA